MHRYLQTAVWFGCVLAAGLTAQAGRSGQVTSHVKVASSGQAAGPVGRGDAAHRAWFTHQRGPGLAPYGYRGIRLSGLIRGNRDGSIASRVSYTSG